MSITDLIFPRFCISCQRPGSYICINCRHLLKPTAKDRCLYCKKVNYLGLTHPVCLKKLSIDGAMSIFQYNGFFKKIMKAYKYRLATLVFKEMTLNINPQYLGKLTSLKEIAGKAYIQPIPLHQSKINQRGFNQAETIAKYFNHYLGLHIGDFIFRKKDTLAQAQTSSLKKRYDNIRGAFKIKNKTKLLNQTIILVDDVATTGATAKEAAKILKKNGALRVFLLTLAKG